MCNNVNCVSADEYAEVMVECAKDCIKQGVGYLMSNLKETNTIVTTTQMESDGKWYDVETILHFNGARVICKLNSELPVIDVVEKRFQQHLDSDYVFVYVDKNN